MVYFHADAGEGAAPEFPLPAHVHDQLAQEGWGKHLDVNLGRLPLSPVDWVDQVGVGALPLSHKKSSGCCCPRVTPPHLTPPHLTRVGLPLPLPLPLPVNHHAVVSRRPTTFPTSTSFTRSL
jgi:hypothetical protein